MIAPIASQQRFDTRLAFRPDQHHGHSDCEVEHCDPKRSAACQQHLASLLSEVKVGSTRPASVLHCICTGSTESNYNFNVGWVRLDGRLRDLNQMGIFRKKSAEELDLFTKCTAIGAAFDEPVVLNQLLEQADDIRALFSEVERNQGIKIAMKSSLSAADSMAQLIGSQRGDRSAIPGRKAAAVMRAVLGDLLP
jgi:hypothetical protein